MERLNREYLLKTDRKFVEKNEALPEKILQFGEGKFIRAFIAYLVQEMNNKGVFNGRMVAVQPVSQGGILDVLEEQDNYYTVMLRGKLDGKVVNEAKKIGVISRGIRAVSEWDKLLKTAESETIEIVISNTTEAGLEYLKEDLIEGEAPTSYPGKLTAWLYHRYKFFKGDKDKSVVIIPCELVERNGEVLKERLSQKITDWKLPEEFKNWVFDSCSICSSLVDRIVTGTPFGEEKEISEKLGYEDAMLTACEPYHLFVVNGDERAKKAIPFHEAGLNVLWEDELPYRDIKVKFLNGAHTLMCASGIANGVETVGDMLASDKWREFITTGVYEEIFPVVNLDADKKNNYIKTIFERFENPFVKHYLQDIAMSGVSKFRERLLSSYKAYVEKFDKLPENLTYTLSSLLYIYKNATLEDANISFSKDGKTFKIKENPVVIEVFKNTLEKIGSDKEYVEAILKNETLWGEDLTLLNNLESTIMDNLNSFDKVLN